MKKQIEWFAMLLVAIALVVMFGQSEAADTPDNVVDKYYNNVYEVTDHVEAERRNGLGTGVWIDEYHMVTNCHVAQMFAVYTREEEDDGNLEPLEVSYKPARAVNWDRSMNFEMEVVACDTHYDLALLRSKWPNHEAEKVDIQWRAPQLGTEVYSAGYRYGLPLAPKVGYYGLRQTMMDTPRVGITIPVGSGDSGSPVFSANGELVAVVSAVYARRTYFGDTIPLVNITIAIPGVIVKLFVEEHMNGSEKGDEG